MLRIVLVFFSLCAIVLAQPVVKPSTGGNAPPIDFIPLPTQDGGMPFVDERIFTDPESIMPQRSTTDLEAEAHSMTAQDRALLLRYREVKVKIEQLPAFVEMRDRAKKAKTPEDSRAAQRTYYRALFAEVAKTAPELADKCKTMETAYLERLAQTRIAPTIPLNPPPAPIPLSNQP